MKTLLLLLLCIPPVEKPQQWTVVLLPPPASHVYKVWTINSPVRPAPIFHPGGQTTLDGPGNPEWETEIYAPTGWFLEVYPKK